MKYREKDILNEVEAYIHSTYGEHYVGKEGFQIQDLLNSIGVAEQFCQANAIKYLARFGKKKGMKPLDLLKAIHYTILLIHFSRSNEESEGEAPVDKKVHNVFELDGETKHYEIKTLFEDEEYSKMGLPKCGLYDEDDQFGEGHHSIIENTEENENNENK